MDEKKGWLKPVNLSKHICYICTHLILKISLLSMFAIYHAGQLEEQKHGQGVMAWSLDA